MIPNLLGNVSLSQVTESSLFQVVEFPLNYSFYYILNGSRWTGLWHDINNMDSWILPRYLQIKGDMESAGGFSLGEYYFAPKSCYNFTMCNDLKLVPCK